MRVRRRPHVRAVSIIVGGDFTKTVVGAEVALLFLGRPILLRATGGPVHLLPRERTCSARGGVS